MTYRVVAALTHEDNDMIVRLASGAGCSLDSSPGKNWVEKSGGLPNYICKIAKGVMRSGKSKSSAIAIAVSRVKAWAAGGDDVDADTRAKAAKAVAEWTALKAKNKSKKVVKASQVELWVEEDFDEELTENEKFLLREDLKLSRDGEALQRIMKLAGK